MGAAAGQRAHAVLAWEAVGVGAGATNQPALDHGSTPSGSRHMPSQLRPAVSAAKDEGFIGFCLRHGYLSSRVYV
jgi:hypothetical protein